MKSSILLAAGLAAIAIVAGCSRGGPATMPAGQWEMKSKLTQLEVPPAIEQMMGPLRAQLNREQSNRTCITQDQASNPLRDLRTMMSRNQPGATCTTNDDTWANGVIRVRVTCRGTTGAPSQGSMSLEGTFTADTMQATMTVNADAPGAAGQSIRMTSTLSGRRLGECTASPGAVRNTL
jgi:hypothetical protein